LCTPTCGNGEIEEGEQCDDGNIHGNDGCAMNCTIEDGFVCPTPGEPCVPASGACCLANNSCVQLSGSGCTAESGVFNGPGTSCDQDADGANVCVDCDDNDDGAIGITSLSLRKFVTNNNTGGPNRTPEEFTLTATAVSGGAITFFGQGPIVFGPNAPYLLPAVFTLSETLFPGYAPGTWSCTGTNSQPVATGNPGEATLTLTAEDDCGATIRCSITNDDRVRGPCCYTPSDQEPSQPIKRCSDNLLEAECAALVGAWTPALSPEPETCANVGCCGDGVINGPSQCDDGNLNNFDGCSSQCRCEQPRGSIIQTSFNKYCEDDDFVAVEFVLSLSGGPGWSTFKRFDCGVGNVEKPCTSDNGVDFDCTCKIKASYSGVVSATFGSRVNGCDLTRTATVTPTINQLQCPDDGLFCNGDEFCYFDEDSCAAECRSTGDPCILDEVCGDNVCNEVNDVCDFTPDNTDCEASEACREYPCGVFGPITIPRPGACEPDCNNNGVPDCDDISDGTSDDDNENGVPDECDGCSYTQGYWKNAEHSAALPDFSYGNPEWQDRCLARRTELFAQCLSISNGPTFVECDVLSQFLGDVDSFCYSLPEYFDLSYPQQGNLRRTDCAKLQRQLFAFLMNTFLGAIGDIPPYTELGAYVSDPLLEEVVGFLNTYPEIFDVRTCFGEQPLTDMERSDLVDFARLLDQYNTGELPGGVAHCDSEQECAYTTFSSSSDCSDGDLLQSGDSECVVRPFGEQTFNYKANCRSDGQVTLSLSDRTNCGGKKEQFRRNELTCFMIQHSPDVYVSINCSGCPDPDLVVNGAEPQAVVEEPVQEQQQLAGVVEPETENDNNGNPDEALEIATLVFVILAFVMILIVLIVLCVYYRRMPANGKGIFARLTLRDHVEAQDKWMN